MTAPLITQFVLDVNKSRSSELLKFLRDGNQIILNDDFFVEALKAGNAYVMLEKNLKLLKQFPLSVFYAKTRGELVRNEIISGKPTERVEIICDENTEKTRYLIGLDEVELKKYLPKLQAEAMVRIIESNEFSKRYIQNTACAADKLDIKNYKSDVTKLEQDMREVAMTVSEMYLNEKCKSFNINDFKIKKSVLFLDIYTRLWRVMNWAIQKGYANSTNITNDNFDLKYILTSCFFDGLLTKEKWMLDCRASVLSFY